MDKKEPSRKQLREFISAVVGALPDDLDASSLQYYIEKKKDVLPRKLREALPVVDDNITKNVIFTFTVVIDYTLSLADMIAAGRYDWKNSDITAKHFPVTGSGQVTVGLELVHFGKDMSTADVLAELDGRNLRPATLPELLAFGAKYPEEQRKYPIIALGSLWSDWSGRRRVAYLNGFGRGRSLRLGGFGSDWLDRCRFLAASQSR